MTTPIDPEIIDTQTPPPRFSPYILQEVRAGGLDEEAHPEPDMESAYADAQDAIREGRSTRIVRIPAEDEIGRSRLRAAMGEAAIAIVENLLSNWSAKHPDAVAYIEARSTYEALIMLTGGR